MSSALNKEWISDDRIDSTSYKKGIFSFLTFILRKNNLEEIQKKYFPCPCRKCCNGTGQYDCDFILSHLLRSGMDKSYTTWYYHGEDAVFNQIRNSSVNEAPITIEEVNDNVFQTLDPQINNVCNEGCVNDNEARDGHVTRKESKYERLKRLAERPLFPASSEASKHSTMDALVMLNDLKTEFNLSDAATEGMIGVLKQLLPVENTLGRKFYEMKCTLKEVNLNCVIYDVCENNCMLFWKDHIDSTHCTKCKLSRFKHARDDENGKKTRPVMSKKRNRGENRVQKLKLVARKRMWYFPIIPRLQRLYSIKWIAEAMTWHQRAKSNVNFMRHPRDSADWKNANRNWKEFAKDPRSVRLALATDGFNPYGCFGASYSCWPVIMQPLNLPPSLTMKSEFSMLTVLIPGPTSPKSRIDIFLQPLVDDLNVLWRGVDAWDAERMEPFNLKAMLLWCIHDFPAYGMLSGCVTHGKVACPICSANTQSTWLNKSKKCCFQCSRTFLSRGHRYRFDTSKNTFNGKIELASPPRKLEGVEVEGITSTIESEIGTSSQHTYDSDEDQVPVSTKGFTKKSILFDLPYWSLHRTRHNLDLMHIEKNVTEILLSTILSLKGSKDTVNAREDLEEMGLKKKLWMKETGKGDGNKKPPPAPFVLSKVDKVSFFKQLKTLRVPSGFSANFRNSVNLKTLSFSFKSHDYHMIMQHLLPMLLMHAYPATDKSLFKAIQVISIFFNVLCAKVVSREHLTKAKVALTEALCVLEIYFPPSFFVIMIHLMHHLGDEAMNAGPPRFRSMWTFEREMKKYKRWARNKRHIEGSIAEAYMLHESSLYAMEYMSSTGKGTHKRNRECFFDDDGQESLEQHVGKVRKVELSATQFVQVRKWVLQQHPEYDDWRRMYVASGPHAPESSWNYAVDDFIIWMGHEGQINMNMMRMARGPNFVVDSYNKFQCNGYTFSTVAYDENKLVQNSGVSMKAINSEGILTTYYGVIRGIFDLDYCENIITVFYCDWVCSDDKTAFRVDPTSNLVLVNLNKVMPSNNVNDEPFILASQASQVFYCKDTKLDGWSIVIPKRKGLTKAIDALEIDPTMYDSIVEENDRLCTLLDPIDR